MEEKEYSAKSKFKGLDSIFITLLASQLFFAVTSLYLVSNKVISSLPGLEETFKLIIMVLTFTSILILRYYYTKSIKKIMTKNTLEEKLYGYYSLNISRMAIVESINLISLIAFLLTGVYIFIIIYAIIFILFIIYRPTIKSFIIELRIKGDEKEQFREMK